MISVEEIADIRGALEVEPLEEVLAGAGLSEESWTACLEELCAALERELRVGKCDLAKRYLARRGLLPPGEGPPSDLARGEATLPLDAVFSMTLPFHPSPPVAPPPGGPLGDPSGETLAPIVGPPTPSVPFSPPELERYAQLVALLRRDPESADAILDRFGLVTIAQRSDTHRV